MTVQDIARATFSQDWAEWHRRHEAALADRHGFLAITGLHWLGADAQRFADAPGGHDIVPPRHPEHPLRVHFGGVPGENIPYERA